MADKTTITFGELKASQPSKNLSIVSMFQIADGRMVVATADEIFILSDGELSPMQMAIDAESFEKCSAWC